MNQLQKICTLMTVIALTGCLPLNSGKKDSSLIHPSAYPKTYQAKGKISVRSNQGSQQASFDWKENPKQSQLNIYGPLGQGSMEAILKENMLEATINGQRYTSNDPEKLLKDLTAVQLPIRAIKYWLVGSPSDQTTLVGHHFIEKGWQVNYLDWQKVNHYRLPKIMTATKENTQVKLVITQWKVN